MQDFDAESGDAACKSTDGESWHEDAGWEFEAAETTVSLLSRGERRKGAHPKVMVVNAALRTSAAPSERTSGPTCEGEVTHRPERRSDL